MQASRSDARKIVLHLNNAFHELFWDTWGGQLGYLQQTITQWYCHYYYTDDDNSNDNSNDNKSDNKSNNNSNDDMNDDNNHNDSNENNSC